MPVVFVLIWSTGFVVARYGMPHAPPLTFLAVRFALSALTLGLWAGLAGAAWPASRSQWLHLAATGVLMHAGYLGGVWAAVKLGLGAGLVALVVGLQPVLTALWLSSRGQRPAPRQWLGLVLGLAGLLLVVWHKLHLGQAQLHALGLAALGLVCITAGTLYQKHWVQPCDVRSASAASSCTALALALFETGPVDLHPQLIGAMVWSVLVLTLGGSSLLYLLIQRGAATAVSSLMYLVPPCTAVLAWWLFGETLNATVLAGLGLTALGVGLVSGWVAGAAARPAAPRR
jgi:drug/metabolite transporter (DMT)-like permease